jgi:hypothetical protein
MNKQMIWATAMAIKMVYEMKSTIFWTITPYSLDKAQRFGNIPPHLQGQRASKKSNHQNQVASWA